MHMCSASHCFGRFQAPSLGPSAFMVSNTVGPASESRNSVQIRVAGALWTRRECQFTNVASAMHGAYRQISGLERKQRVVLVGHLELQSHSTCDGMPCGTRRQTARSLDAR
jgi:hypothetical protein